MSKINFKIPEETSSELIKLRAKGKLTEYRKLRDAIFWVARDTYPHVVELAEELERG